MHGVITSFDVKKREGRIQGDDGHIYLFKCADLLRNEDEDALFVNMETSFTPAGDPSLRRCSDLEVLNPEKARNLQRFFIEPENLPVCKEELVDGYDILDHGLYRLERRDRFEERALMRLRADCVSVGANAVVGYRVSTELKSAFGFGYNLYVVSGVPVAMGRADPEGDVSAEDLSKRLDQDKIRKMHNVLVNTKIGKMVVRFLALVLLGVFVAGFLISLGL